MLNSPGQTFRLPLSFRFSLTIKATALVVLTVVLTVAASAMMTTVMTVASRAVTVLIAKSRSGSGIETRVLCQGRRARQDGKKDC